MIFQENFLQASLLEMVHSNIYSLVQEWNAIQEVIATSVLQDKYDSKLTPVNIAPNPLVVGAKPEHKSPQASPKQSSFPIDSNVGATDIKPDSNFPQMSKTVSRVSMQPFNVEFSEGSNCESPSPINIIGKPEASVESQENSMSHLEHSHSCNTIDEDIPGSQIMLAADCTSQSIRDSLTAPTKTNVIHSGVHCSPVFPLPDYSPNVPPSGDFVLEACGASDIKPFSSHMSELAAFPTHTNYTPSDGLFRRSNTVYSKPTEKYNSIVSDWVQVRTSDLDCLTAEAMMLKEYLPKVVNSHYISCVRRVPLLEKKLGEARREREELTMQSSTLLRRCDAMMTDLEEGRKELFAVKVTRC